MAANATSNFLSALRLIGLLIGVFALGACGSSAGVGGAGGPTFSGGAAGSQCFPQSQNEGCFYADGNYQRMKCEADGSWKQVEVCGGGKLCAETPDPANTALKVTACTAAQSGGGDASTSGGGADGGSTSGADGATSGGGADGGSTSGGGTDGGAVSDGGGTSGGGLDTVSGPVCGDGKCEAPEDKASCATDCGEVVKPACGNGKCEEGENPSNCVMDCKDEPEAKCGDSKCEATKGETAANCPADCAGSGPKCGDGTCEGPETEQTCPADCKKVAPGSCKGKKCEYEKDATCQCDSGCAKYGDCCADRAEVCGGSCTPDCKDKTCGADGCGGSCGSCPDGKYCNAQFACQASAGGAVCGNGKCETGETPSNCSKDCTGATGTCKAQGCKFSSGAKCQCDSGCKQYKDCCSDYDTVCASSGG